MLTTPWRLGLSARLLYRLGFLFFIGAFLLTIQPALAYSKLQPTTIQEQSLLLPLGTHPRSYALS